MATTEQDNKEFARRWNDEVWEKRNLDLIDDLVAEEFIGYDPSLPEPIRGPDGVRKIAEMMLSAFPDAQVDLEEVVAEGDLIAVRIRCTGTHEGEYMGIDPTGEDVQFQLMAFQRIEDGKVVEERQMVDHLGLLAQLGVVDPPTG
jgi:steroid delta-isomerase-like uncharacterized protein